MWCMAYGSKIKIAGGDFIDNSVPKINYKILQSHLYDQVQTFIKCTTKTF